MRLLFALFFLPAILWSLQDDPFADDEDPTLFHHVSVLSGHLQLCFNDGAVHGAKEIPLVRTYTSAGSLERTPQNHDLMLKALRSGWLVQGGWNLFPHANLLITSTLKLKQMEAHLPEKSGSVATYVYDSFSKGRYVKLKPKQRGNQCSGALTARTNSKNNVLEIDLKTYDATLYLPDGGFRIYYGENLYPNHAPKGGQFYYLLQEEALPSTPQRIYYHYDKKRRLEEIVYTTVHRDKIFSSIRLHHQGSSKPFPIELSCSDGKTLSYRAQEFKNRFYLNCTQSSGKPLETIAYEQTRKGTGLQLTRLSSGERTEVVVHYIGAPNEKIEAKWAKHPDKVSGFADRIARLEAHVGAQGELMTIAAFDYSDRYTDVRDVHGILRRYHHNGERLHRIDYFDEQDRLVSSLQFIWSEGALRAKVMLDASGQALFSKTFVCDPLGNVTCETLWGNLTGERPAPFALKQNGELEGAESVSKWIAYSKEMNLPIRVVEEGGNEIRTTYLPHTDLIASKLTLANGKIVHREFFLYDQESFLIEEITDDGTREEPADLEGVSEMRVRRIVRDPTTCLPMKISHLYLDLATGCEKIITEKALTYSKSKQVIKETTLDAQGCERFSIFKDFDASGKLVKETTPTGEENLYTYDALGNLIQSKEAGSAQKNICYDHALRPIQITEVGPDKEERTTTTHYDAKGRITEEIDFQGNVKRQLFDAFGRCLETHFPQTVDEEGKLYTPIARFAYDLQGNIVATSDPQGRITRTTYNALRKPVCITRPDGSKITHTYSKTGALLKTLYPDGSTKRYAYDPFQRKTKEEIFSKEGELVRSESWEYNAFHLTSTIDARGLVTRFKYDGAGRKVEESAEERTKTFAYDAFGFLERTQEGECCRVEMHDVAGKVIESWDEDATIFKENHVRTLYDSEGRKRQAITVTAQGEALDRFCYDAWGRLTAHIDPLGNATRFEYDDAHLNERCEKVLQKRSINPLHHTLIETFDTLGRLVCKERTDHQGAILSCVEQIYDRSGNRVRLQSSVFEGTEKTRLHTLTFAYDALGRLIEEKQPDGSATTFSYDAHDNIEERVLPSGVHLWTSTDAAGRLLFQKSSDGTLHTTWHYDQGPDPHTIVDHVLHRTVTHMTNRFGNPVQECTPDGNTLFWEYDALGRCTRLTLPDGSCIAKTYLGAHLRSVARIAPDGKEFYAHRYTRFDPNGHVAIEEMISSLGTIESARDLLERPTHQEGPFLHQGAAYGPSGLVMQTENSLLKNKTYAYDALDQLIQAEEAAYRFDSLGNPARVPHDGAGRPLSSNEHTLCYDANGNPQSIGSPSAETFYTYDALGRLTSITEPLVKRILLSYDPLSRLYDEEVLTYAEGGWQSKGRRLFLHDGDTEIGSLSPSGDLLELKVLGLGVKGDIGAAVAIEVQGEVFAPLSDFSGHIIALVTTSGHIRERYPMDPFGRMVPPDDALINPWRFCSKRTLHGFVVFKERLYAPALSRWLTPDPAGCAEGPNLYLYVLNSPLNRLDRFGLLSEALMPLPRIEISIPDIMHVTSESILKGVGIFGEVRVDLYISGAFLSRVIPNPEDLAVGKINIYPHMVQHMPKEGSACCLISVGNGIRTSLKEFASYQQSLLDRIPEGTPIISLHNPTGGFFYDYDRVKKEMMHLETDSVVRERQFLVVLSDALYKVNPSAVWLYFGHSERGLLSLRAIEGMTDEQKQKIHSQLFYIGVGPAAPMPKDLALDAFNVYSDKDYITLSFGKPFLNRSGYDIRIVKSLTPCKERILWIADHAFLGPTYQIDGVQEGIGEIRKNYGFYNIQTR